MDDEECGKTRDKSENESTNDDELGDDPTVVEFEDPVYELSQSYEMEPEYKNMTAEQEAAEVQALSPAKQAKYRELTQLHQRQADIEKKMTGVSKIIKERTKVWAPGLPVDLIERNMQVEPAERQELHRMTKKQKTRAQMKQDEIPRMDKPGTSRGCCLFVEDDAGCIIEQCSGQAI